MKNLYFGLLILLIITPLQNINAQCNFETGTVTDIVFVKEIGHGDSTGTSWDNALSGRVLAKFLREKAVIHTKIYVAAGTYYTCYPSCGDTARTRYFEINDNITFKGGFAANSTGTDTLTNRDMKLNVTRLSGEYQQDGDRTNNSYHVMRINTGVEAIIGGFYVSDGYAFGTGTPHQQDGGGILSFGGVSSTVAIGHMVVEDNTANFGGGFYLDKNKAIVLDHVIVRNNTSLVNFGGAGIFAWGNFTLFNSVVNDNTGHGLTSWNGDIGISNSTINNNTKAGVLVTNASATDKLRLRVISSTITDNNEFGIRLENKKTDSMSINLNNNLIINNASLNSPVSKNINFGNPNPPANDLPVDIVRWQYSIVGDSMFTQNYEDRSLLPRPVALGPLADNGGWGDTQALLDICNNPAVDAGDNDLLTDETITGTFTDLDQRDIFREFPPCIGAFDAIEGKYTLWQGDVSSDWSDSANWYKGVPVACSYVIIPKGKPNYPIINSSTNAVCDTVSFEAGSEIGGIPHLTYNYAKCDLEIQSNRWYTLTAPLNEMYSGDYFLSANRINPSVYMMQYQAENPQTGVAEAIGQWSNPFNTLDIRLVPGMGFSVWIDKDPTDTVSFDFPKLNKRYYYYDADGNQLNNFVDITRLDTGRFIFNDALETNKSFVLPVNHGTDVNYSSLIVGNPFISHLDFFSFYNTNSTLFQNKFQIWKGGTSFESYIIDINNNIVIDTETGSDGGVDGLMIPPMQSFLITRAGSQLFTDVLFTPLMSVTQPEQPGPRSSSLSGTVSNLLKLNITDVNDQRQSGIAIRLKEGANNAYQPQEDVWAVFPGEKPTNPILYSLTSGKASSINTLNDASINIELGIAKDSAGRFDLNASGLESFGSGYNIYLEDRQTKTKQNLRENSSYTFDAGTGYVKGRFFILVEKDLTSIEDIEPQDAVSIYSSNNSLHITTSPNSTILGVEIFGTQGQLLLKKEHLNDSQVIIPLAQLNKQLLIVKVQTSNGYVVQKILN